MNKKYFIVWTTILIIFSALIAAFSMYLTPNTVRQIEKVVMRDESNIILQTPHEEHKWAKKLQDDINIAKKPTPIAFNFYHHQKSLNQNYLNPSHTYQINAKFYLYVRHSWGEIFGNTGGIRQNGVFVSFSNGNKNVLTSKTATNFTEAKCTSSWTKSNSAAAIANYKIPISSYLFGSSASSNDLINKISIKPVNFQRMDDEDEGYTELQSFELWDLTSNKKIFSSNEHIKWSAETGNTYDNWYSSFVTEKSINLTGDFHTQKYHDNKNYESLKIDKIFMTKEEINNNPLSKIVSDRDNWIRKFVKISHGTTDLTQYAIFSGITLDTRGHKLKFDVNIRKNSLDYYDARTITIPIVVVNLDYLISGSTTSSSYWKHNSDGTTSYHTLKPTTKIFLSETYVKSFYIQSSKESLIRKLNTDSWGFEGSDKLLAISSINSSSLNVENYEKVRNSYLTSKDPQIFRNLTVDKNLDKFRDFFKGLTINEFAYLLKNLNVDFKYGDLTSTKITKKVSDLISGLDLALTSSEISRSPNKISWVVKVSDLHFTANLSKIHLETSNAKFDLPSGVYKNYDLQLAYNSFSEKSIIHKYLFQSHGINITNDISFVMENGTLLDQNYKVTSTSNISKLKVGDFGYKRIRYLAEFDSGKIEYINLTKDRSGDWYTTKYSQKIKNLLTKHPFNEKNIEYLFDQNLQMVINPYQKNLGTAINSNTTQKFGIKRVLDHINNTDLVMEDWDDGKWSHAHGNDGLAKFDGIFGANTANILDSTGHIGEGIHRISIELQNASSSLGKSSFNITIDKSPVFAKVQGLSSDVKKMSIKTPEDDEQELYFSKGPIRFIIEDEDIISARAQFVDHNGKWYEVPVNIKSFEEDGEWQQLIDSTIDYAGFSKVIVVDSAGNVKNLFFWLKQSSNQEIDIGFDHSLLVDDEERKIDGIPLHVFESKPEIIISSPLLETSGLEIQKLDYIDHEFSLSKSKDFSVIDYVKMPGSNYQFGKSIDSDNSVLKFAGDELQPMLKGEQMLVNKWPILNKKIEFSGSGLYKLDFSTRLVDEKTITEYIYVKDGKMELFDLGDISDTKSYFGVLPKKDGSNIDEDNHVIMVQDLQLNMPDFLISSSKIEFSLPWYSEFSDITSTFNFNGDLNKEKNKEGKYKIFIEDIFGGLHNYKVILIKNKLTEEERNNEELGEIYGSAIPSEKNSRLGTKLARKTGQYSPKGKRQLAHKLTKEDYAFWNGKMIWNYYRYEDANHAYWERKNFVDNAMKNGLTREQAEALYAYMKRNSNWDGSEASLKKTNFDYKLALDQFKNNDGFGEFSSQGNNNPNAPNNNQPEAIDGSSEFQLTENNNPKKSNGQRLNNHEEFVVKAMEAGLTNKEAENLYSYMEANYEGGAGNGINSDGSPMDFNALLHQYENPNTFNPESIKKESNKKLIGTIVGSVIGSLSAIGLGSWLIYKRIKGKKIT